MIKKTAHWLSPTYMHEHSNDENQENWINTDSLIVARINAHSIFPLYP